MYLREGQCSDFPGADGVLKDLPPAATVVGDQGMAGTKTEGCTEWVTKSGRSFPDGQNWRPITTRYDRCAPTFRSAILLAAMALFW